MVWLIVNIVTGKEYHRLNKPLVKNWFCMVKLNWKKVCFLCLMKTTESFKGFTDITQLHPEATVAIHSTSAMPKTIIMYPNYPTH